MIPFLVLLADVSVAQISAIGSFEGELPSYWTKGSEPSGATLTWATDQYRSMGRSLKIEKSATSEAAMWESENMVDLWSERHFANVDIKLGAFVRTENVNTNPANDDERWYISYTFYDSAGAEIGEVQLPVDQSTASSSGWVADTNGVGETVLPEDSWKTIIKFVGGKNATGTVWADDFILIGRNDGWAGQDWNTAVGVPTGWFYWLPPKGGQDGVLENGYEKTMITDEEAYNGTYSLKMEPDGTHDGFVGTVKLPLEQEGLAVGDIVRISVWLKGENLYPDSVAAVGDQWSVAITPILHNTYGNNAGWGEFWSSDIPLKFPNAASFDWKKFSVDVEIRETAQAISIRIHPLGRFKGTIYADALTMEKLDLPDINAIGGFESELPSYWTKGSEPSGATLTWATDQYRSMGRSLKIEKSATSEAAMWESENMVDLWSERHFANVDIKLGAFVRTENVNTNPANDDERWYISYTFYDSAGAEIGEVQLPVDQSTASSSGWVADTNGVGETVLPEDSWKTIIKFVGGKNATGTVWADDFILIGRNDGWAGQDWNTAVGVPTGWFYWLPPKGGQDGVLENGYEKTMITDEEAYNGTYSLKMEPDGTHDGFVGTVKFPVELAGAQGRAVRSNLPVIKDIAVGDTLTASVWIKAMNLYPDSVAAVGDQWSVAITPILHNTYGNNAGWGEFWSSDIPLVFPSATEFDWTQFSVDFAVQENTEAISVRIHPLGRFIGTFYADDLEIKKKTITTDVADNSVLPKEFVLENNYPNPFNPATTLAYSVPRESNVSLVIYNILGQKVRTLVNDFKNAGRYTVTWNGLDDSGSAVSSGIYFYSLVSGDVTLVKKMVMLK
jgi:hypothetical protein